MFSAISPYIIHIERITMHSSARSPLIGVIDIGSNSVRLVIYDDLCRVPRAIYNEKHSCRLGERMMQTGKLSEGGRIEALEAIGRFVMLSEAMEVRRLYAVATAAVRNAEDGQDFANQVQRNYDLSIDIISGEQEAKLAAAGVRSSIYRPDGITADMGGGSLELAAMDTSFYTSSPLGALSLYEQYGDDTAAMRQYIRATLTTLLADQPNYHAKALYAVGGSFRSIARLHADEHDYPLPIIHYYTLGANIVESYTSRLLQLCKAQPDTFNKVEDKRIPLLPAACISLQELLRATNASDVVFSSAGIREGIMYDLASKEIQQQDALDASLMQLGGSMVDEDYANALLEWIQPLFPEESSSEYRLRRAACLLSDIAQTINPEFRAEWVFEHVLVSNLWGISHPERVKIALALYYRYRGRKRPQHPVLSLLDEASIYWAKKTGMAMRLAFEISAGTPMMLAHLPLILTNANTLRIAGERTLYDALPSSAEKRLKTLNKLLNEC